MWAVRLPLIFFEVQMQGIVEHWNDSRDVGTIIDDDGKKHFALRANIAHDEIGRRYLIPGEAVSFQLGVDNVGRPAAIKVKPIWRESVDIENYAGEYCVVNDDPRFATRPVGGNIFLGGSNFFHTDNVVLVTRFCTPNRPGQCWVAGDPQFVAHTQDEFEALECLRT